MLKTTAALLAIASTAVMLPASASASLYPSYIRKHYPKSIQPLLLRENALDEQCHGAPQSLAKQQRICRARDVVVAQIKTRGWCWGSKDPDAVEADMTWLPCRDDRTDSYRR